MTLGSGVDEENVASASEKILQLEIELDRQSQKLSDLGMMGAVIASMLDNEQALPVVMEMALRSVGAEVGAILMEEGSELVTRVGWGIDDVLLRSIQLETGEHISDIYNDSEEAILINTPLTAKNVGVHIHNLLATPVKSRNKRHGLVIVINKEGGGDFTDGDKETLQALSNFLAVAIENAQLLEESLEKQRIQQELIVAQQVQESILPKQSLQFPGISIGAVYVPAREVGGDFYSLIPLSDTEFVLIIGDVSSKGVPAALIMAAVSGIINATLKHCPNMAISDLASQLNDSLCEGIVKDKDMFATIWFGRFDLKRGKLTYCNSGHLPPLYRRSKDNELSELSIGGSIVGQFLGITFDEGSLDFEKGDSFVLFTDGLTEAENRGKELFGRERAAQFFRKNANLEPQEFCDRLKSHVDNFARGSSDESHDDFTALMVRINEDSRVG
ncbi:MAG: SpoIIE family protein phosphatase [candidate division Zixibacteria bacterium]|nr:SpoIIE family protein phosphatase [candidate division Zixibacteria bacterium]